MRRSPPKRLWDATPRRDPEGTTATPIGNTAVESAFAEREAAQRAYTMADCGPQDIDLAEVHDCFTIAEICVTEALGLVEKGKGGAAVEAGETALNGRIPVNPSGGLKSKGHPVGATGIAQIVELTEQLRGEADDRQVQNAKRGLAQNMGGTGGSTTVHILEVK